MHHLKNYKKHLMDTLEKDCAIAYMLHKLMCQVVVS